MRGFYIGRFQPYHNGHHTVVEQIASEIDELIMGIGSADISHTIRDPFTAGERMMMITKSLVDLELDFVPYVVPIEDIDRNAVWVSHIKSMSPDFSIAYSNNPLVIQLFEEAGVEVRQIGMINREELEGTEIRARMMNDEEWKSSVPPQVAEVISEIKGIQRIQRINQTDANGLGSD